MTISISIDDQIECVKAYAFALAKLPEPQAQRPLIALELAKIFAVIKTLESVKATQAADLFPRPTHNPPR
jgi:hypothetical protein